MRAPNWLEVSRPIRQTFFGACAKEFVAQPGYRLKAVTDDFSR
jgi:hypothetical protein